jgi:formamidopyrimidine-DNA glycosylase
MAEQTLLPFFCILFSVGSRMPELPDVLLYLHALTPRVVGQPIERVRIVSPFVLRSVNPPLQAVESKRVTALRRLGKRIVFELEGNLFLVIHLMIAGRFRWRDRNAAVPGKVGLAAIDFPNGTLLLTEAGTQKRASLHVLAGEAALSAHDPGGLEVLEASRDGFAGALVRENHTLKRALTDPHLFSGIGNAYSDEILHAAKMSPLKQTRQLTDEEITRLYSAVQSTLRGWITRLRDETGVDFPEKVTAFRPGMAVHGRFREPCPVCGSPVQRIVYATNEANYCARCQTGGRLLADRSLSRLLKDDWPRRLEDLERGPR